MLPVGTVTFLFSDIEGSTEMLQRLGPGYAGVLATHHAIVRRSLAGHGGREVDTAGDGFFAAFERATDALAAAAEIQRALAAEAWPAGETVRVRMGLHTGEPIASAEGYTGLDVHRAARIMAAGWGGQVLVSAATDALARGSLPAGLSLRDLGAHRLKDLAEPEQLFQLVIDGLPSDFPPPRSAGGLPHNLPAPPTPLIGREEEMARVLAVFADGARLLTLTGPGGTGKTRLAIEVASRVLAGEGVPGQLQGGAWFVQLAPVTDPALVTPAIADAVGARERAGRPTLESVAEHIGARPTMLVLDNFEQVLAAAPIVGDLLAGCPGLRALATSRAPLRLRGEQEMPVPPLGLPDPGHVNTDDLSQYAAVRLFIDRATAVRPDFMIDDRTAPAVAAICARLDGLPLAIELAAARVRLFSPEAMLARLARPLEMLRGGARDLPDRHQTLRDTIGWSYDLLPADPQRVFRRLAVFTGGCTLESAAALDPAVADVAEYVLALIDQSLLRRDEGADGEPRFRMLETVREFATDALAAEGELDETLDAHAMHFLALAEEAEPHLTGKDQSHWLNRLDAEQANLRGALARFEDTGRIEEALRMGNALGRFWIVRGHLGEGYRRLLRLVELSEGGKPTPAWIGVRNTAGIMAQEAGGEGLRLAVRLLEENVAASREHRDRAGLATALSHLGHVHIDAGRAEEAGPLCREALELQRELGDRRGVAVALQNLSRLAVLEGRFAESEALLEESRAERHAHGEQRGMAFAQHGLAYSSLLRSRPAEALARAEEGLRLLEGFVDSQVEAVLKTDLALILLDLNRPAEAYALAQEAIELWERNGNESGLSYAQEMLGLSQFDLGDREKGLALVTEATRRLESTQFKWMAGLGELLAGDALLAAGDVAGARAAFADALEFNMTTGIPRVIADSLVGLGAATVDNDPREAEALFRRAAAVLESSGGALSPRQAARYGSALAAAGVVLPEETQVSG